MAGQYAAPPDVGHAGREPAIAACDLLPQPLQQLDVASLAQLAQPYLVAPAPAAPAAPPALAQQATPADRPWPEQPQRQARHGQAEDGPQGDAAMFKTDEWRM